MFHEPPALAPSEAVLAPLPEAGDRPWRIIDVVVGAGLLALGFAITIALAVVITARGHADREDPAIALLFTVATLLVEAWSGVIVLLLARRRGISLRGLGLRAPASWSFVPMALLGAYLSVLGYAMAIVGLERLTGADLSSLRGSNQIPEDLARTPLIWTILGAAVVVAAPACEELFFRGLVYRALAGRAGPVAGIVISGIAFSAVHVNAGVVVPFALIGMIFAWAYRASGSLWTTILAHAIFNGISFAAAVYGVAS